MKKILMVIAAVAVLQTVAYAQSIDFSGDVTGGKSVEVTNLENGYYDLTAVCKNTSEEGVSYLYGVSDGYTAASTVLPVSADGVKVTVRGIEVENGKCTIGVGTDGNGVIEVSDVDLVKTDKQNGFIQGGDMTEVDYIENLGGEYKDSDGNKVDPFEFLSQNGMNMARIRLSNTPGKGTGDGVYYLPSGFQDEEDCLKLAKRAKDAGMGIQFTFNYSDYWSNGSRQIIPSEWVKQIKDELGYDVKNADFLNSMTSEQREEIQDKFAEIVYNYTYDIMSKLKAQGTVPEYVSLGNEIRGGMLFPFGNTYDASMNRDRFELVFGDDKNADEDIKCPKDWEGLVKFINAGYDAVKAVSEDSKVIIHLDDGSKSNKFTYFFDELDKLGAKYDVIGASYYPAWTDNNAEACKEFCNEISKKYDKDIMIMETGFNWNETRKDGYAGQLKDSDVYKDIYPPTMTGHKNFMAELFNELKSVDDNRCLGVLYWDPCMIHVEDKDNKNASLSGWAVKESDDKTDVNVVENTTLFDFDGKAIPSVDVYKHSSSSKEEVNIQTTSDEKNVKTRIENNTDSTKKVSVIVIGYDENNVINSVQNVSKEVNANTAEIVSVNLPQGKSAVYVWNGSRLIKK